MTAPVDYDTELSRYSAALGRAWAVRTGDHVLDIGCGTGQTTREAARMARAGSALGVDVSAPAVERARELARAEGLHNVTFEHADAQTHRFAEGYFDLAISRFGTMFFDDPVAAFGNIGRALRPAGRLVMLVWQAHDRNEWDVAIHEALTGPDGSRVVAGDGPDPFSLADPATVEENPGGRRVRRHRPHPRPGTHLLRCGRRGCPHLGSWLREYHASSWSGSIPAQRLAPSRVCMRSSRRIRPTTASGSIPARGSSPPIAAE